MVILPVAPRQKVRCLECITSAFVVTLPVAPRQLFYLEVHELGLHQVACYEES